ncbi:hypothetical protein HK101_008254 [Irineochytrium annulatum]|nr:hypothetical protein HK101_008254 [Irineochytrium annulatum]
MQYVPVIFSYKFPYIGIYVNLFRDCYEGFAVYAFFSLCLLYLGHDWSAQRDSMQGKPPRRYPPPMCCLFYDPRAPNFLIYCKLGIIQLSLSRIASSTFTVFMEQEGVFGPESMSPKFGHFWVVIVNSVGMGDLPGGRPIYQFLSIKYVLFIPYIQNMILQIFVSTGYLHGDDTWTVIDIVTAIASSLTCLEMAIASLLHVLAFPYTEFAKEGDEVRLSFGQACFDALRPDDLWSDAVLVFDFFFGWIFGRNALDAVRDREGRYSGVALLPDNDEGSDLGADSQALLTTDDV